MASSSFNANDGGTGSILASNAVWATARGATTGSLDSYATGISCVVYGGVYYLNRLFVTFDTSSIPNGDTIESATLEVYCAYADTAGSQSVCLVQSTQASSTSLAAGDFDQVGAVELASRRSFITEGDKTFTLNSSGLALISKTAYSEFALRSARDFDNSAPTSSSYIDNLISNLESTYLYVTHWGQERYWVGGQGNWNDRANWSDTSGGAGGAPIPTSSDNVHFDANSFSGANQDVIIDSTAYCNNMTWTGATNSPNVYGSATMFVYGSFTTIAAMTWTHSGYVYLESTSGGNFTSNGIAFNCKLVFSGVGSTWTLQDNLTTTNTLYLTDGTLNTNGKTVTTETFWSSYTAHTRVLTLGASTINCSGTWECTTATNLTVNAGTSTINMTGASTEFNGGGKTYNTVVLTGTPITIKGNNTFATLTLTAGKRVNFNNTQVFTTALNCTGSAGNLITIRSTATGTAITLTNSTGSIITGDYLDIQDSTGAGAHGWDAGDNSINSGNNTGWASAWTSPSNAGASDGNYATHTSSDGKIYAKLSKDGGTTWSSAQYVTHVGVEGELTFGNGSTELWGSTWNGGDVDDTSFAIRLYVVSASSFNYMTITNFHFEDAPDSVPAGSTVTGIEVITEAKWDGTTTSLDFIKVRVYAGDSPIQIAAGSFSYDTTVATPTYYNGGYWYPVSPLLPPRGHLINGQITVSISANDLVVSLKTLAGNDASATDPIYVRIGDTVQKCTAALSKTLADGTNWFNAGSTELATRSINYFVYLIWNTTPATDIVDLGFSRIPYGNTYNDFSSTTTNEKYLPYANADEPTSTDLVENIGRFTATLSAGAGYTWTFTANSIINRPIYETQVLAWNPVYSASGSMTWTSVTTTSANYYKLTGHRQCFITGNATGTTGGTASNSLFVTLPFDTNQSAGAQNWAITGFTRDATSGVNIAGFAFTVPSTPDYISQYKYDGSNYGLGSGRRTFFAGWYPI